MFTFIAIILIAFALIISIMLALGLIRKEDKQDRRYSDVIKAHPPILRMWTYSKLGILIAAAVILMIIDSCFIFTQEGHQYYVLAPTGKRTTIVTPGVKLIMPFSQIQEWSKYIDVKGVPTDVEGNIIQDTEGIEGIIPNGVNVMFIDRAMAQVYISIRFELPNDEEAFIKLVETYKTPKNLINNTLLPAINEQLTNVSYMYSADEYVSGAASDYKATIEDALKNGGFVVKRTEITDTLYTPELITIDSLVNRPRKIQEIRTFSKNIKVMENGIPKRIPHEINVNEIITASVIVSDVVLESTFMTKLQQQRDISVEKIIEIQKIETAAAAQQRIIAEGERDKSQERVNQEKEQITVLIAEETKVKQEESKRQLAEIAFKTAELEAKALKVSADAKAYENAKLVSAGLTPQQKAEYAYKTAIGVAAELKNLKLPETYIQGGNGGSSDNILTQLIGAELAKGMMNTTKD